VDAIIDHIVEKLALGRFGQSAHQGSPS
jgi:hypothetical protein